MIKILIGLALSLSMMATTLPIYAKENKDSIYENELNEAILSGSGTENDPYIVDYEKAPNFHEYVINVYEEARGESNLRASGFTGYVLTTYKGVYNNGASWDLISYMIDNGLNSGLYSAVNNGTSCVNVVYLSSYHGAWYQNKATEGGWTGNAVYIPSSTYGTGTFVAN